MWSFSTMVTVTVFSMMSVSASTTDPESKLRILFYVESTPPPGVSCEEDRQNAMNIKPDQGGKGKKSPKRAQRQTSSLVDGLTTAFEDITQLPEDAFVVDGAGVVESDFWVDDDDWWPSVDDDPWGGSDDTSWLDDDFNIPLGTSGPTMMPHNPLTGFRQRRDVAPPSPPAPPVPEPCKPLVVAFNVRVFQPLDELDDLKEAVTEGFTDFGFVYNDGNTVVRPHSKVVARVGKGQGKGKGNAKGDGKGKGGGRHAREEESASAIFEHVNKNVDMHSMVVAVCLSVGTLSVIFAGVYVVVRKNRAPETNNKAISLEHVSLNVQ